VRSQLSCLRNGCVNSRAEMTESIHTTAQFKLISSTEMKSVVCFKSVFSNDLSNENKLRVSVLKK